MEPWLQSALAAAGGALLALFVDHMLRREESSRSKLREAEILLEYVRWELQEIPYRREPVDPLTVPLTSIELMIRGRHFGRLPKNVMQRLLVLSYLNKHCNQLLDYRGANVRAVSRSVDESQQELMNRLEDEIITHRLIVVQGAKDTIEVIDKYFEHRKTLRGRLFPTWCPDELRDPTVEISVWANPEGTEASQCATEVK